MRDPTETLSKDVAKKIAAHFESRKDFFSFASVNKRVRHFFQEEFQALLVHGKIIANGNNSYFYLTWDGDLYASGVNCFGQLGFGDTEKRWAWMKTGPNGKKVDRLFSHSGNSFAFCDDGLYACGLNKYCQMGLGHKESPIPWVRIGPLCKKVVDIAGVTINSIFLQCEDGWYAAGDNFWGELGTGDRKKQWDWVKIEIHNKVILEIVVGDSSTFVRCEDGWYGCGYNSYCEIISGNRQDCVLEWVKISPPGKTVLKLISNRHAVFVACEDGWYARGCNHNGRFGTGDNTDALDWIKIGISGKNILELQTNDCGHNTFIRCADGWYGCGIDPTAPYDRNLGIHCRPYWKKIKFPGGSIYQLRGNNLQDIFICSQDGWYARGSNWQGKLGLGEMEAVDHWVRLGPAGKKTDRLVNESSTFILCDDGWYACGENYFGQLDPGDNKNRREWIKVPLLDAQHSAFLDEAESETKRLKL